MKNVIIFGTSEIAELMHFYFSNSKEFNLLGFCINKEYKTLDNFCNLPVFDYEHVLDNYPPNKCSIFVAMAYNNFMKNREKVFQMVKSDGYSCPSFVCEGAKVLNKKLGENTVVFEHVTIQPGVEIGNNILISPSVTIAHHSKIEDNVYVGPNVSICGHNTIRSNVFIGANTVVAPKVELKGNSFIGAGAKIFQNTKPDSAYIEPGTNPLPGKIDSYKHIIYY